MRASKSFFATGFVRSQETARPLIKKLGLKTVTEYSDTAGLVEKLRAMSDQTVLVVAHSDTLPTIIAAHDHQGAQNAVAIRS